LKLFIEEGLLLEDVSRDGPTGLAANRRFVEISDDLRRGRWIARTGPLAQRIGGRTHIADEVIRNHMVLKIGSLASWDTVSG